MDTWCNIQRASHLGVHFNWFTLAGIYGPRGFYLLRCSCSATLPWCQVFFCAPTSNDGWIMREGEKKRRKKKKKRQRPFESKYGCDKKYSSGLVIEPSLLGIYKPDWILFSAVPLQSHDCYLVMWICFSWDIRQHMLCIDIKVQETFQQTNWRGQEKFRMPLDWLSSVCRYANRLYYVVCDRLFLC